MTKSDKPKVIYNARYILAFNNRGNQKYKKENIQKRITDMYNYYKDDKKKAMSMYDYYRGYINKENSVNLVIENGKFATEKEVEQRKKQAVKYLENSNLYQGVLSFDNDYINKHIDIHKLEYELATKILPMFFKKCGFKDPDKMFYQLSLHTDTDNLHFHFSFMEKEPNYSYSCKNLDYRKRGKITKSEKDFLKAQVVHFIEKEKIYTPLLKETNKELESLKKYFNPLEKNFLLKDKEDLLYEEKILRLGQLLDDRQNDNNRKIKYGSIKNDEIKKLTREIKNYIFTKDEDFKTEYKKFKVSLNKINSYFYNLYEDNNIKNIKIDTILIDSKNKYLDNYVYNAIVNHALYNYKRKSKNISKIKENDIIKAIVLREYQRNKGQGKLDILSSCFSNNGSAKYKNKNDIGKAVKNINNELEEAQKEFSKLFNNDKENKLS